MTTIFRAACYFAPVAAVGYGLMYLIQAAGL